MSKKSIIFKNIYIFERLGKITNAHVLNFKPPKLLFSNQLSQLFIVPETSYVQKY